MYFELTNGTKLPGLISAPVAAKLMGIGRTTAHRMLVDGSFPTPTMVMSPVGERRIVTRHLLDALGLEYTITGEAKSAVSA